MKKLFLLIVSMAFFSTQNMNAQVSVSVNFGTPPVWAPADRLEVQYYYLPDIDVYYDVPHQQYIYLYNRTWIRASVLPSRCRNYNLRNGNIVYLTDYRGNSPYMYHKKHKLKYYHPEPSQRVVVVDNDYDRHDNGEHRGKKNRKHGRD